MQVPFNFMAAVAICSDFGAQDNKVCHCFCCFPIYLPWSDRTWCLILNFWMLNFKPTFSVSFFTFIKRLFSSSFSAIRVVSSAYLRLSIFPPAVLIPGGTTSSLAFYIIYSAYKLNKQSDNKQHWYHFSSVQSVSCVQLFATQRTTARQTSLSITNSQSLLKLMSIESVMPSNHLILCHPLLFLP